MRLHREPAQARLRSGVAGPPLPNSYRGPIASLPVKRQPKPVVVPEPGVLLRLQQRSRTLTAILTTFVLSAAGAAAVVHADVALAKENRADSYVTSAGTPGTHHVQSLRKPSEILHESDKDLDGYTGGSYFELSSLHIAKGTLDAEGLCYNMLYRKAFKLDAAASSVESCDTSQPVTRVSPPDANGIAYVNRQLDRIGYTVAESVVRLGGTHRASNISETAARVEANFTCLPNKAGIKVAEINSDGKATVTDCPVTTKYEHLDWGGGGDLPQYALRGTGMKYAHAYYGSDVDAFTVTFRKPSPGLHLRQASHPRWHLVNGRPTWRIGSLKTNLGRGHFSRNKSLAFSVYVGKHVRVGRRVCTDLGYLATAEKSGVHYIDRQHEKWCVSVLRRKPGRYTRYRGPSTH